MKLEQYNADFLTNEILDFTPNNTEPFNLDVFACNNIVFVGGEKPLYHKAKVVPINVQKQAIDINNCLNMLYKYTVYVEKYNTALPTLNKAVHHQHQQVATTLLQHALLQKQATATAALQKQFSRISTVEYNRIVDIKNAQFGMPILEYELYKPVTKPIEHTFSLILFLYAMQLDKKNKQYEAIGATTKYPIRKAQINANELVTYRSSNDSFLLPYSKFTVYNHIKRLVSAGILFDYEFCGSKKPVNYHINPEILEIFDEKNQKVITTKNKLFTTQIAS